MKRIISLLICTLILMTSLCVVASAEGTGNNTYTFETKDAHVTVKFYDNNLTEEQQIIVAEGLAFGNKDDSAQPYGLGCTLFGHDYRYTESSVIYHKALPYAPRCKVLTYDVTYCDDCDYYEETLTGTSYIHCCPED